MCESRRQVGPLPGELEPSFVGLAQTGFSSELGATCTPHSDGADTPASMVLAPDASDAGFFAEWESYEKRGAELLGPASREEVLALPDIYFYARYDCFSQLSVLMPE